MKLKLIDKAIAVYFAEEHDAIKHSPTYSV